MTVTYHCQDGIAEITLNRPESLNALNRPMYHEINEAFQRFLADDDAAVAIFCSACERAFCAGVDIKDINQAMTVEGLTLADLADDLTIFFEEPGQLSKPVIAAINGHCAGEGLVMSLFCDLRIASPDARFSLPEAKIGVPSVNGTIRAVQLIGHAQAMELLLTGDARDAGWALNAGLVNAVVDKDDLMAHARDLANGIASNDATSIAIMRQIGEAAMEQPFEALLAQGLATRESLSDANMVERQSQFINKKKS
jgi:E-phenylitaconyl-CoA hydratase